MCVAYQTCLMPAQKALNKRKACMKHVSNEPIKKKGLRVMHAFTEKKKKERFAAHKSHSKIRQEVQIITKQIMAARKKGQPAATADNSEK